MVPVRRVQVERYPQTVPAIKKLVVVAIRYLFWCHTFLFRADYDWGSVLVAARYHQHIVPSESVVAGKDVGRQVAAGDVSKVKGPIGVRPGYANENALFHSEFSYEKKKAADDNAHGLEITKKWPRVS